MSASDTGPTVVDTLAIQQSTITPQLNTSIPPETAPKNRRNYFKSIQEQHGMVAFVKTLKYQKWWNNENDDPLDITHLLHPYEVIRASLNNAAILYRTTDTLNDTPTYARSPGRLFMTNYQFIFRPLPCCCEPNASGHEEGCNIYGPCSDAGIPFTKWPIDDVREYNVPSIHLPLSAIAHVEIVGNQLIVLNTKDIRKIRIQFRTSSECEGFRVLLDAFAFHENKVSLFAFIRRDLHMEYQPNQSISDICSVLDAKAIQEYTRLGFLSDKTDDISHIHSFVVKPLRLLQQDDTFDYCSTYPKSILVPISITDAMIQKSCAFRSRGRFPVPVWMHPINGAILARCAQPLSGLRNFRCEEDEQLVQELMKIGSMRSARSYTTSPGKLSDQGKSPSKSWSESFDFDIPDEMADFSLYTTDQSNTMSALSGVLSNLNPWSNIKSSDVNEDEPSSAEASQENCSTSESKQQDDMNSFYILDARSQIASMGNRALGKGTENISCYPGGKMLFMNIDNIHTVRTCFNKLYQSVTIGGTEDDDQDFVRFEQAKLNWMQQVRSVLKASITMARILHQEGKSVLTHCSDGWDRTSQMVSLVQIMLDPHFRTIKGFGTLIEKEWISFGHKFLDRCGSVGYPKKDDQEISPVFLLWVDCVWQLLSQFPKAFEFNELFLIALLDHVHSGRFDTFLFNSEKQRVQFYQNHETLNVGGNESLWNALNEPLYLNCDYIAGYSAIIPSYNGRCLEFWKSYFLRWDPLSGTEWVRTKYLI